MVTPKNTTKVNPKKILVVDDHPIMRYGIIRTINEEKDLTVCGEAEDDKDAIRAIKKFKPDLVILDISLGNCDGLVLAKSIHVKHPTLPILMLSMHDESLYARKALKCGARGYIMKDESSRKLAVAIRDVLNGEVYVSDNVKKNVLKVFAKGETNNDEPVVHHLSARERQVFIMIGEGYATSDIAGKLCVSCKTIDTHRARIKSKLEIKTMSELVRNASSWVSKEGLSTSLL